MSLFRSTIAAFNTINRFHKPGHVRCIKRWVGPTLRELRIRAKKMGPQPVNPRSTYSDWNYRAELFAFGKRLNEDFQLTRLQTAFTVPSYVEREKHRQKELGIEDSDITIIDNSELSEKGKQAVNAYVRSYLQYSLEKVPEEGREEIANYLLSTSTLAHIASHLGMVELIQSVNYPPSEADLEQSLLAVIGCLQESSGLPRTFSFIRDFICTQLNQRDLLDIWKIEKPLQLLEETCKKRKMPDPEPRLIGSCGKNTVIAAYHIGMFINKNLIGKGFGEDISTAIEAASLNALQKLFGIDDNMRPFNFEIQVESTKIKLPIN